MVYVLKCRYFDEGPVRTYAHEKLVLFKVHELYQRRNCLIDVGGISWPRDGEEYCVVLEKDVIQRARNLAYLSLRKIRMKEEKEMAVVSIYNSSNKSIESYAVPLTEIFVLPNS